MVTMRYFGEFYYFLILFLFLVVLSLLHFRYAFFIMVVLLAVYLPSNVGSFLNARPELRLVQGTPNFDWIKDTHQRFRSYFIERNVVWFNGSISYDCAATARRYNAIGIAPGPRGLLQAQDVSAIYIIPKLHGDLRHRNGRISIREITSTVGNGSVKVYVDGRFVGRIKLKSGKSANISFSVSSLPDAALPCQILVVFFPGTQEYLSPIPPPTSVLTFREIKLERCGSTDSGKETLR